MYPQMKRSDAKPGCFALGAGSHQFKGFLIFNMVCHYKI